MAWIINPSSRRFLSSLTPSLRWGFRLFVALIMAVGAAWLAFKDVAMAGVYQHMRHISDPWWGGWLVAMGGVTVGCRAFRWQWVIRHMAGTLSWRLSLRALWVGQMTNALLPAKLGEAIKLGLLKRGGVPLGLGVSWVMTDRVLDGLSIAAVGAVGWGGMIWGGGHVARWVGVAVLLGSVLFGLLGMGMMLIPHWAWVGRLMGYLPSRIQPIAAEWVGHMQQIRRRMTTRLWVGGLLVGWVNWGAEMGMLWGIAKMMGVTLPGWLVALGVAFTAFGGLVISAPAGVGTVHFLLITALVSGGVSLESSAAIAIWMHAWGLLLQVLSGIGGLLGWQGRPA